MSPAAVYSYDWPCHGGITTCPQGQASKRLCSFEIHAERAKRHESGSDISTEVSALPALTASERGLACLRLRTIPALTPILVLLCFGCCFNRQRLSRVAEGTGPLKPQQPGATAKVLIPAQVGRDKILD